MFLILFVKHVRLNEQKEVDMVNKVPRDKIITSVEFLGQCQLAFMQV